MDGVPVCPVRSLSSTFFPSWCNNPKGPIPRSVTPGWTKFLTTHSRNSSLSFGPGPPSRDSSPFPREPPVLVGRKVRREAVVSGTDPREVCPGDLGVFGLVT